MVSTEHVRTMLRGLHPEVDQFERAQLLIELPSSSADALSEILRRWREVLQEQEFQTVKEQAVQITVTRAALVRWLGDGMLTGAVRVMNPDQTTILDLLRVIDYPNDYVPVVAEVAASNPFPAVGSTQLRVINKAMLNAQLARNYVDDMLTSLGLRFRL